MATPHTSAAVSPASRVLEEAVPLLDCDEEMDDYAPTLLETPDGTDFIAHYCGLEYLGKWSHPEAED